MGARGGSAGQTNADTGQKFKDVPWIPEMTPDRGRLTLQPGNKMRREIVFELTSLQPYVRLVIGE